MSFGLSELIIGIIVFGVCFWSPTLASVLRRKQKVAIVGQELLPILLPSIAGISFYEEDWFFGSLGTIASVGYFLGLWYVYKNDNVRGISAPRPR